MPKARDPAARDAPAGSARHAGADPSTADASTRRRGAMLPWLWLSLLVLILDQATKWTVMSLLAPFEVVELVPNLNLTLMFNTGAAFSVLADAGGWQRWVFAAAAVGITAALVVWLRRLGPGEGWIALGLALLIGGAVGNLIDRLLLGHVIDFIQVYLPRVPLALFNPWPSFNIADSAISIGVVVLLVTTLLTPDRP